jgi:hypothetical protein
MIRTGVKISPGLGAKLNRAVDQGVETIMATYVDIVRPLTPKDKGRARRAWQVKGRGRNAEAVNEVAYARRLDEGYSKQAPRGMTKPALRKLRSQSRRITR